MSKRFVLLVASVCALTLLVPYVAPAQEARQFEAFGSFSYLFADVGGSGLSDVSGVGFNGEFAFFVNDWLGIGAEVGYNTGDLDIPVIAIFPALDINFSQWTVLFGPRFRFAETERFRVGAQAMAGIARGSIAIDLNFEEPLILVPGQPPRRFDLLAFDFDVDDTVFAVMFGVHFAVLINERITWRVMQPDVLVTSYGNEAQTHFRISSGLGFEL